MTAKVLKVKVIKISGNKSLLCQASFLVKHPSYEKYVTKYKKYLVHDENNLKKVGDEILIQETRPISKRKQWRVAEE